VFGTLANDGDGSQGYGDTFIVKYNTDGLAQWSARLGSYGTETALGVATDSSGNVYITGLYYYPSTIYNANGTVFGSLMYSGTYDVFVVKYNTSGTVQWAANITTYGFDSGYSIATDSSANVYIVGYFPTYPIQPMTVYNADGTTTITVPTAGEPGQAFLVKYNTSGTAQWGTRVEASGTGAGAEAFDVATDSSGNVYMCGRYGYATNLSMYNANNTLFGTLRGSSNNAGFVVKYNTSGTVQWGAVIVGTTGTYATGITVDSSGNVYVSGNYAQTVTFYNSNDTSFGTLTDAVGTGGFYVVKYNSSGTVQWIVSTGSFFGEVYRISIDSSANVYITGQGSGGYTCIIQKRNSSGTLQWTARGTATSLGSDIASRGAGNVYVTGFYNANPFVLYNQGL
jgi:hypothetical protein